MHRINATISLSRASHMPETSADRRAPAPISPAFSPTCCMSFFSSEDYVWASDIGIWTHLYLTRPFLLAQIAAAAVLTTVALAVAPAAQAAQEAFMVAEV